MKVSVVVCAYTMERWDALSAAVRSCLDQTRAADEVILVIDHNDVLLARARRDLPDVRVVANQSTKGLSGARNSGVTLASGDVVAFLDDDAYAAKDWLEELTAPFADARVAGVGGWIVPHWETSRPAWFPETFYWILGCSYQGLPQSDAVIRNPIGASMALRRRVFTSVGGFTSGLGRVGVTPLGCEETEICIRYGARFPDDRFVLRREAVVSHRVPASRLTWHYFWTRCWAEGLSKAAVASLVGANRGLAAERRHVLRSVPRELGQNVRMLPRHPVTAIARSGLAAVGTAVAAAGFVRGRWLLRRSPLAPFDEERTTFSTTPTGSVPSATHQDFESRP